VWAVLEAMDQGRNPGERLRNYLCAKEETSLNCKTYEGIFQESVDDSNSKMRSNIRAQCVRKIERIKEEEGADVP
jgi:hypothetical protein